MDMGAAVFAATLGTFVALGWLFVTITAVTGWIIYSAIKEIQEGRD